MLRQMERSTIHLLAKRGKSIRQIAAELGRSPTTISRVLQEPVDAAAGQAVSPLEGRPLPAADRGLAAGGADGGADAGAGARRPRAALPGGHSVFRGSVRRVRLEQQQQQATAEVPIRFEGLPAEYLQVDWGEVRHFPFTQQAAGDALLPGLPAQVQPLDLGALHRRHAPGDPLPRPGRLLPGAGLGALGAGLRQHEDGDERARRARASRSGRRRCCQLAARVRLPSRRPATPGRATRRAAWSRW